MAHRKSLEALDRTLKDPRKNSTLMGGVLLFLSGDFRQTLPVIPRSTPADEINACLKQSIFWDQVEKFSLRDNLRALLTTDPNAQTFAENLLKIGNGTFPIDTESGKIILTNDLSNLVEVLIEKIYPQIVTRKDVVQKINESVQNMIPSEEKITNL